MTKTPFLYLPDTDKADILNEIAKQSGKDAIILEKDIWLCWTLEHLFKMPNKLKMAFKGGTSLSKVYNVIHRFSEDIDITIDYTELNHEDPFDKHISNTKRKKLSEQIKLNVEQHIKDDILPYYQSIITSQFKNNRPSVELSNDKDEYKIKFVYPSVIKSQEQKNSYLQDSVILEFGGRNNTLPNNQHKISPYVAEQFQLKEKLTFPVAMVTVLAPEKTFWEKVTLIHREYKRNQTKGDANPHFRHWYDVTMLAECDIGQNALKNRKLLEDVVKTKKVFYHDSYSNYDDCLNGKCSLLPNDTLLKLLKNDYRKMVGSKMFYDKNEPQFEDIMNKIECIEEKINDIDGI